MYRKNTVVIGMVNVATFGVAVGKVCKVVRSYSYNAEPYLSLEDENGNVFECPNRCGENDVDGEFTFWWEKAPKGTVSK